MGLISGYKLDPRPTAIISFFPYCANFLDGLAYDSTHLPSKHLVKQVRNLTKIAIGAPNEDARHKLLFQSLKEQKGGWLLVSHDPHEDPNLIREKLKEFSAVEHIDENYPPTYLSHGQNDIIVPFNQSIQMAERLEQHGRDVVLDLSPGGHSYDLLPPENIWKEHIVPAFDWAGMQVGKAAQAARHKKD